jgi:ankyrin repeat protein
MPYIKDQLRNVIREMQARGLDINAKDGSGLTSLHLACALGDLTAVECLVEEPKIDLTVVSARYDDSNPKQQTKH